MVITRLKHKKKKKTVLELILLIPQTNERNTSHTTTKTHGILRHMKYDVTTDQNNCSSFSSSLK